MWCTSAWDPWEGRSVGPKLLDGTSASAHQPPEQPGAGKCQFFPNWMKAQNNINIHLGKAGWQCPKVQAPWWMFREHPSRDNSERSGKVRPRHQQTMPFVILQLPMAMPGHIWHFRNNHPSLSLASLPAKFNCLNEQSYIVLIVWWANLNQVEYTETQSGPEKRSRDPNQQSYALLTPSKPFSPLLRC